MPPTPITLIPGDGIGPELIGSACEVLSALSVPIAWREHAGAYRDAASGHLPDDLASSARRTGLVLKGTTTLDGDHTLLTGLFRNEFDLYANIRPAWSLLPGGRFGAIDVILIRENTEGLYAGVEHYIALGSDPHAVAEATGVITREGCRRIARFAFDYALKHERKKVTIIHKANILKALTGLFLETAMESARRYDGRLTVEDRIVDACAMQLVLAPGRFDVLLTTNMFGDILADQLAGQVGGLSMSASATVGDAVAVFEPLGEAQPALAGRGAVNPVGMLLSAVLLLFHIGAAEAARRLRAAIAAALADPKLRTPDLGGRASAQDITRAIIGCL
jgi:isocitrate dehydrogenase (NAD+)